jgi:small subunit ribosomal protein S1
VEAAATWRELKVGDERDGVIAGHQEFGIFVDIGGVQGLVHKSELGWGDENPPPDVGTTVKVQVKSIDPERQRISLTMKDPAHGPWARVGTEFLVGGSYTGTVTRVADYGAFVKLSHGLEGLVHISQMADHRIDHPRSVVRKDQEVTVRILEVDREQGRISLSMRQDAGDGTAWQEHKTQKKQKQTFGTLGDILSGLKLD